MSFRYRMATVISWAAVLLIALSAWASNPGQPAAAQGAATKPGVDILLLVDQSGSMGGLAAGSTAHPDPNDRLGLRFEGPQDLVSLIAEDKLQASADALHRVAMIAFGDRAVVRLPWTDVAPGSWEELRAQTSSLNAAGGGLDTGPFTNTNLGNTNFQLAFDQAAKVFGQLPAGGTDRVRAIIVLTDGQPCVPPPATPTPGPETPTATPGGYSSPCLNPVRHMQDLQKQIREAFPADQYRIYVVAMNDSRDNYWPAMEGFWQTITGSPERAQKVTSNDDLGIALRKYWREITPEEVGTVEQIAPGPQVVPPYLDTITFTLFKSRPEENLEISDGTNTLLTKDTPNVEITGENILKVKVFRPLPGLWRVSTTGSQENIDIEMRAVVAKGNLNSPTGSQVQFVPTSIEWQLLDSRGQPLPEYTDARYRLEPSVQVKADGEVTPVTLQYKGNSTYEATFTPVKAALHTITMEAIAHDLNNAPITVFSGEVATFAVGQVSLQPVDLAPSHSQFTPLTLTYELRDPAGQPVGVKSSVTVSVTVQSVGGASWSVPMLAAADGSFRGEFVPLEAGPQNIRVAASITEPSGNVRPLTEGPGGSFNVTPLLVTPKSPAGAQAQHLPMTIAYQVLDGQGNELKLGPGYQMVFTGTIGIGGQEAPMLTLEPTDATTYAAIFLPDQQGNYSLATFASVQAPDGRLYPAYAHRTQVAVIPTTRLALQIVHPGPKDLIQYVRRLGINPLKFFSVPNKLAIELQLADEMGQPVDPRAVLFEGATMPVELKVVDADGKKDYSDKFTLAATGVPGVFRAEGSELPIGRYNISGAVVPAVRTQPAYVIPVASRSAQAQVQLRENPFWLALWIAIIVAFVGLIAYLIFHQWQLRQLSKHPASGTIVVENEYGQILASPTIAGRNRLVLKGFPTQTQIKRLEIRCANETDSKQGAVQFSAQLIDGTRTSGRLARGGGRVVLGRYKVYLRKTT